MSIFNRNTPVDAVDSTDNTVDAAASTTATAESQTTDTEAAAKAAERRRRWRRRLGVALGVIVVVMMLGFWLRYLNPYVSDGVEQGYIMKVERRGFVFKTWEGDMILSRALTDTVHVYQREFAFSVAKTDVAEQLQEYQSTGRQVRVGYKQYLGTLPWRGASTVVVTSVTPVDDAPQCAPVEALATADEE